jgi:hypothetical protein
MSRLCQIREYSQPRHRIIEQGNLFTELRKVENGSRTSARQSQVSNVIISVTVEADLGRAYCACWNDNNGDQLFTRRKRRISAYNGSESRTGDETQKRDQTSDWYNL